MMAEKITHEEGREPGKAPPRRLCAGCGKRDLADNLVRVVLGPGQDAEAEVAVDLADGRFGRGAHVHPTTECVTKAARGGLAKAFKTKITTTAEAIGAQIAAAAVRRVEGLLTGAKRGKLAIAGGDVVREALRDGTAVLVVVASDAAAAVKLPEIEEAIRTGKAVSFGNKNELGAIFGRDEVAVCAVLHEGVADAIGGALRMALPFAGSRSGAWSSSEVR